MTNLESLEKICNDFPHNSIYMTTTKPIHNEKHFQIYHTLHRSSFTAAFILQER